MALRDNELARRGPDGVDCREGPARIRWRLGGLSAADGHDVEAVFSCGVGVLSAPAERKMLEEVFLTGRAAMTVDDVRQHLVPALRAAARDVAERYPAVEAVGGAHKGEMIDALRRAGEAAVFTCGLELLGPFELEMESRSLQRQQAEALQRRLAEERAAGRIEHLQRAGALFEQFEALRRAAPQLPAGEILRQISPADRAETLEALLVAAAGGETTQQPLWAVAGPYLVRIATEPDAGKPELIRAPEEVGPLRSIRQSGEDGKLLIGARCGVLWCNADRPADMTAFVDPVITSSLGFNRAVFWHDRLWACHGDAGIVCWDVGNASEPRFTLRPDQLNLKSEDRPSGIRHLQPLDDSRMIFSNGARLMTIDAAGVAVPMVGEAASDIVELIARGPSLIVVQADGRIVLRDRQSVAPIDEPLHRHGRILAAAALPWLGDIRLLLGGEGAVIDCIGLEDQLLTQYHSVHRGPRIVSASAGRIAAVSADRQRIIVWDVGNGRAPAGEVLLTRHTRHRVADVSFA